MFFLGIARVGSSTSVSFAMFMADLVLLRSPSGGLQSKLFMIVVAVMPRL